MAVVLTAAQREQAERDRMVAVNAQCERDECALVEIVYRGKFVRFDISTMQARCLTPEQLVERCFREAFEMVGLTPHQAESSAYASSSVA